MITVEKSLFIYESIKYCIRGFNSSVKKKGEKQEEELLYKPQIIYVTYGPGGPS